MLTDSQIPGLTTLVVEDAPTLARIYRLRVEVWRATGTALADDAFPDGVWTDKHDSSSTHWAVFDPGGEIVAAARLSLHATLAQMVEPFQYERYGIVPVGLVAAPDRVVVHPVAQRQGLAVHLLDLQDRAALLAGATCALRQASPSMCRLLVKRGWELAGPALPDQRFPGVEFTVASKRFAPAVERHHAA